MRKIEDVQALRAAVDKYVECCKAYTEAAQEYAQVFAAMHKKAEPLVATPEEWNAYAQAEADRKAFVEKFLLKRNQAAAALTTYADALRRELPGYGWIVFADLAVRQHGSTLKVLDLTTTEGLEELERARAA